MNFRKPSEKEEEFFLQEELKKRKKIQEERLEAMKDEEKLKLKETHWMRCPKCGMQLEELHLSGVEVDKCTSCGGIYLDAGELETILSLNDVSLMKRLFKVFS